MIIQIHIMINQNIIRYINIMTCYQTPICLIKFIIEMFNIFIRIITFKIGVGTKLFLDTIYHQENRQVVTYIGN